MKKARYTPLFMILCLFSCNSPSTDHFFLNEYPQLQFERENGSIYPERRFIASTNEYGVLTFSVRGYAAQLVDKKKDNPYTGFVRTYYDDLYNLEARFKNGWIQRLRVWHPNRVLAMDRDYMTGRGSAWDSQGRLTVNWEDSETQIRNPQTGKMRRLIQDSVTWYFDENGMVDWFSVTSDTAITQYYADSTARFRYPRERFGAATGSVKRWYPNGSLHIDGYYVNGEESGIWKEYDRNGKLVKEIDYRDPEQS